MSVTSSYSNNHDHRIGDCGIEIEVYSDARFHRVPVAECLDASRERIAECDRERGHTLKVTENGIECVKCEAMWTEE